MRPVISCLALALLGALPSCGGGGEKPKEVQKKSEVRTLVQEGSNPATTKSGEAKPQGEPAGAPATSRQEAARRAMVDQLTQKLAASKDSLERSEVLATLGGLGPVAMPAIAAVRSAATEDDIDIRMSALEAAAAIDPKGVQPLLELALKDEEEAVRSKAAEAWLKAEIKDVTPLLQGLGAETSARVQLAVMQTVEKLASPALAEVVQNMIPRVDPSAASPAVRFLVANKHAPAAPVLAELLSWRDGDLRTTAAEGLGALGNKGQPILLSLVRALQDDELKVRKAAIAALKSLTGKDLEFDPEAPAESREISARAWKDLVSKAG